MISISNDDIIPEKQEKKYNAPFQEEHFFWWISSSQSKILQPPPNFPGFDPHVADLYIHSNLAKKTEQAWIFRENREEKLVWENITESWRSKPKNVHHPAPPSGRDRVLTKQGRNTPYWSLVKWLLALCFGSRYSIPYRLLSIYIGTCCWTAIWISS